MGAVETVINKYIWNNATAIGAVVEVKKTKEFAPKYTIISRYYWS
jgi:hypothetical protein